MRCTVSMATLSEEGKKKRVCSLCPLSSVPLPPALLSSVSLLVSCPPPQLARPFVQAPDDTPDAPAQPPFSATFTSLPSGQRSPPGI